MSDDREIGRGRWLRLVDRDGWEFVERIRGRTVACIAAVTEAGELVLVEQFRPAVGRAVIELPAGLVGDEAGAESESIVAAAARELHEETGFEPGPRGLEPGPRLVASAGHTTEAAHLLIARDVRRTGPGGGVSGESITVHLVPLADLHDRLDRWLEDGLDVDGRVLAGLAVLLRNGSSSRPSS